MITKEILPDQWIQFLDRFSKQHEGWVVNVELVGAEIGDQEQSTRLPLVGISADTKGSRPRIEVIVGGRLDAHLTHVIDAPRRVWLKLPEEPAHEAIEIESEGGATTLVHFRHVPPTQAERQLPGRA